MQKLPVQPPAWLRLLFAELWQPALVAAAFWWFSWPGLILAVVVLVGQVMFDTYRSRESRRGQLNADYEAAGWSDQRLVEILNELGHDEVRLVRPSKWAARGLRILPGSPAYLIASNAALNPHSHDDPQISKRRLRAMVAHELAHLEGRHSLLVDAVMMTGLALILAVTGASLAWALNESWRWLTLVLLIAIAAPYALVIAGSRLLYYCEFAADRVAARKTEAAILRECLQAEAEAESLERQAAEMLNYMIQCDLPEAYRAPLIRAGSARDVHAMCEAVAAADDWLEMEYPSWRQQNGKLESFWRRLWRGTQAYWQRLSNDHPDLTTRIERLRQ